MHARPLILLKSGSRALHTSIHTLKTLSDWTQKPGRTRSILLDEDNPITNKDKYKLHKSYPKYHNDDVDTIPDNVVKGWETDPYRA